MTINSRPPRDDQQDRSAFVTRATEQDTAKLQCWIPRRDALLAEGAGPPETLEHDRAGNRGAAGLPRASSRVDRGHHVRSSPHVQRAGLRLASQT